MERRVRNCKEKLSIFSYIYKRKCVWVPVLFFFPHFFSYFRHVEDKVLLSIRSCLFHTLFVIYFSSLGVLCIMFKHQRWTDFYQPLLKLTGLRQPNCTPTSHTCIQFSRRSLVKNKELHEQSTRVLRDLIQWRVPFSYSDCEQDLLTLVVRAADGSKLCYLGYEGSFS